MGTDGGASLVLHTLTGVVGVPHEHCTYFIQGTANTLVSEKIGIVIKTNASKGTIKWIRYIKNFHHAN